MTPDEDDHDVLRTWHSQARETPGTPLDGRILAAARAHRARRKLLPLAIAMAACLVLALYAMRPAQQPSPPPMPDTSTFGLYEGRDWTRTASSDGAWQKMIRRMPGGSATSEIVSP